MVLTSAGLLMAHLEAWPVPFGSTAFLEAIDYVGGRVVRESRGAFVLLVRAPLDRWACAEQQFAFSLSRLDGMTHAVDMVPVTTFRSAVEFRDALEAMALTVLHSPAQVPNAV